MSQVVTLELQDEQMERLQRAARKLGRTPTEVGISLLEEGLRLVEFPNIEFRDSAMGREAYVLGTRLAVWLLVSIAQGYQMNEQETANHLEWPLYKVKAALDYAAAFPDEINTALEEYDAIDFEAIKRILPHAKEYVVTEDE